MTVSNGDLLALAKTITSEGLAWLDSLFASKGCFPVKFSDSVETDRHFAWTSAEALLAFFEAGVEPSDKYILKFLNTIIKSAEKSPRGGKLIPALGEYSLDRGMIESTIRTVVTLSEIRYNMLKKGISGYAIDEQIKEIDSLEMARMIEYYLVGLEKNVNDRGGWGTFYGEMSRIDPTAHALIAFIRCRQSKESFLDIIEETKNWLIDARQDDKGWGATASSAQSDPGNTALALIALSYVLPITDQVLVDGVAFLQQCVNDGSRDDVLDDLVLTDLGMGNVRQGICIPSAPRMIQALLACGIHPGDPSIVSLMKDIYAKRREEKLQGGFSKVFGWGLQSAQNSTWYTSIVVYACTEFLRYAQYAGNRLDSMERNILSARIESLSQETIKGKETIGSLLVEQNKIKHNLGIFNIHNAKRYRRIAYLTTAISIVTLLCLSLSLFFLDKFVPGYGLVWMSSSFGLGSLASIYPIWRGYLRRVFPDEKGSNINGH